MDEDATGENERLEQDEKQVYFLRDLLAGKDVAVCFEPLTADDTNALNGPDWQRARFGAVWKVWAEHELALKLTLCEGEGELVLGLVKLGTVQRINGAGSLCDSLLEAAPIHRSGAIGRRYRGIGSVLVARLVVESKAQGAEGRLRVRPAQGSIPFYERLGFLSVSGTPYYVLEAKQAEELLTACMPSPM